MRASLGSCAQVGWKPGSGGHGMQGNRGSAKPLVAPTCVHVYVWVFMVMLGVSPVLWMLASRDSFERRDVLTALALVAFIQAALFMAQARCSSEDLTYWEGLLAAAASVTTGENLISLARALPLLFAIVVLSVVFALDHDAHSPVRHAQLRFGNLIVWAHKQRLRR
jgi:hypothetical protein